MLGTTLTPVLWMTLAAAVAQLDPKALAQGLQQIAECTCVPVSDCPKGRLHNAGEGLIKDRTSVNCASGYVCCKPPPPAPEFTVPTKGPNIFTYTLPVTPVPASITTLWPTWTLPLTIKKTTTIAPTTQSVITTSSPPNENRCGIFSAKPRMGGEETEVEDHPWTVAVFLKSINGNVFKYSFAGSLIHHRAVLTAAHNIKRTKPKDIKIRAGAHDLTSENSMWQPQERLVTEIVKHEKYSTVAKLNDVAILILETPITTKYGYIGFVCLPTSSMQTAQGTVCQVSSWGVDRVGGSTQDSRKTVDLPIVDKLTCEAKLHSIEGFNQLFELPPTTLCAGGEAGVDTCNGDGGAALVCNLPNNFDRFYQAGITSWGIGCGVAGRPAMYTSVAAVRSWIDQKMYERGHNTDTYTI